MAGEKTEMTLQEQLNQANELQAQRFAEQLSEPFRTEFLQETADRRRFEQALENQKNRQKPPLARLGFSLLGLILIASGIVYWQTGRYQAVEAGMAAFTQFQHSRADQPSEVRNATYIASLQNRLRENPNDGDLWFELAQAYTLDNEFENAMICYRNAEGILGRTAAILGGMATVEYYRNRHQITPQIRLWLDEALAKDAHQNAALLLLAADAFLKNAFEEAIGYWEKALESDTQAIDRQAVIRSIQAAKARLNGE